MQQPILKTYSILLRDGNRKQIVKKQPHAWMLKRVLSLVLVFGLVLGGIVHYTSAANTIATFTTTEDFTTDTTSSNVIVEDGSVTLGTEGFTSVVSGYQYSLAIRADGSLWSWGAYHDGNLGLGEFVSSGDSPTIVGSDYDWAKIATKQTSSFGIKTDGTLWAWGTNSSGELGLGDDSNIYYVPTQVGTDTDWADIATGSGYTLAIKTDGTLWTWGYNGEGELGIGVSDEDFHGEPAQVGTDTDWESVSAGDGQSFAIKTNGKLYGWGLNTGGQLGLNDTTNREEPTQIGTDTDWNKVYGGPSGNAVALKDGGTIFTWGSNSNGELGLGDAVDRDEPTQVGTDTDWTSSISVYNHVMAVKTDGTLWGWGYNDEAELGLGDTDLHLSPTQIGSDTDWGVVSAGSKSTIAIKQDGSYWAWGSNSTDDLGIGTALYTMVPTQVEDDTDWLQISTEAGITVGLKNDGTFWYWGDFTALGFPVIVTSPLQNGTDTDWASMSYANGRAMLIKDDGTLWGWGSNQLGQLGLGDEDDRLTPTQVGTDTDWQSVTAGNATLAIKTDGTLWSWGSNDNGQLGNGTSDTDPHPDPTQVGTDTDWASVSTSYGATLALKQDGTLWSWGANDFGQLGQGTSDGDPHPDPTQVGTDTDWNSVHFLYASAGAIKNDGTIWVWGSSANDEDAHPDPTQVGTDTDWTDFLAGSASIALKSDGTLWTWGYNGVGNLGQGTRDGDIHIDPEQVGTDTDWNKISTDGNSSFAIKDDNSLWSWGGNSSGQLGLGFRSSLRETPINNPDAAYFYKQAGSISGFKVDAGEVTTWNSLNWISESLPENTTIVFYVRTSDDDITYSDWSDEYTQSDLGSTGGAQDLTAITPSRYLEITLELGTSNNEATPTLNSFTVDYGSSSQTSSGSVANPDSCTPSKPCGNQCSNNYNIQECNTNDSGKYCLGASFFDSCVTQDEYVPGMNLNPNNPSNVPGSNGLALISPIQTFLRNLSFGSIGEDVKRLQIFLNENNFSVSDSGAGSKGNETNYYGEKTRSAITRFQEYYMTQILTPLGLTKGTGYFGNSTRGFVNSLVK
jgi:alpha-tubulin suppressor-like RCC1 family protein